METAIRNGKSIWGAGRREFGVIDFDLEMKRIAFAPEKFLLLEFKRHVP